MLQFFSEYTNWEDYLNGMYETTFKNKEHLISCSFDLLTNLNEFDLVCYNVIDTWIVSSAVNLTNKSSNRRAWLGQASCSFKYATPEILTRIAWGNMSNIQREKANKIADKHILNYEKQWKLRLKILLSNGKQDAIKMEYQTKLQFD